MITNFELGGKDPAYVCKDADPNIQNFNGQTPLFYAVWNVYPRCDKNSGSKNALPIIKMLLKKGANPDHESFSGTPRDQINKEIPDLRGEVKRLFEIQQHRQRAAQVSVAPAA